MQFGDCESRINLLRMRDDFDLRREWMRLQNSTGVSDVSFEEFSAAFESIQQECARGTHVALLRSGGGRMSQHHRLLQQVTFGLLRPMNDGDIERAILEKIRDGKLVMCPGYRYIAERVFQLRAIRAAARVGAGPKAVREMDALRGRSETVTPSQLRRMGVSEGHVHSQTRSSSSLDEQIKRIGDVIAAGEGNYESYNTGTNGRYGPVGHSYIRKPKGTITGKTINEILGTEHRSYDDPARFYTTGKYQTIIPTLREGVAKLHLSGDELYDAAMQERMFRDFLIDHAGGGVLIKFIKKGLGTVDDAQFAASQEWASIATPSGRRIKNGRVSDGTLSYYEGANNHANMRSTSELRSVLEEISKSR
jgi:hypothetical protein